MTDYPQEYFDDKKEQAKIKSAIIDAIPKDVRYSNLIVALSEMLTYFARKQFEDYHIDDDE